MGQDVVAAGVLPGVAMVGEGVGATTGHPWRMTPSMLAMGRRRAEVEAVGAAAMVGEVDVEAVDLARVRMEDPSGGNMTAGTAQAVGERPVLKPHLSVSCPCMSPFSAPTDHSSHWLRTNFAGARRRSVTEQEGGTGEPRVMRSRSKPFFFIDDEASHVRCNYPGNPDISLEVS